MPLPDVPLGRGTVTIGGSSVEFRSLSRDEVVSLATLDVTAAEVFMISHATGYTEDEAIAWRRQVDAHTADQLLSAIARISGLRPPVEESKGEA